MAGWAGFTDDDLKEIKETSPGPPSQQAARQQAMAKKQKLQQQRELARKRAAEFSQGQKSENALSQEQRLTHPQPATQKTVLTKGSDQKEIKTSAPDESGNGKKDVSESSHSHSQNATEKEDLGPDVKELNEEEALSKELSKVDQFRCQQQKMEEENKQRRRLLADAIKQRSKMARAEAEKLTKVQKELSHLDSLVNADVAIIRDRIEAASMEFLQAQKRYERAEKEFVTAKMALAEKSEAKESLTEHLYTVIQQNEQRKAARLATLMKELGLEGEDGPVTLTSLPPLHAFSPFNTLHKPSFPPTPPTSNPTSPDSCGPQTTGSENVTQNQENVTVNSSESNNNTVEESSKESSPSPPNPDPESAQKEAVVSSAAVSSQSNGVSDVGDKKGRTVDSGSPGSEKPDENGSAESQDGGADALSMKS